MTNKKSGDDEVTGLQLEIARLEELAQDAEDREHLSRASKLRAKARELKSRLSRTVAS